MRVRQNTPVDSCPLVRRFLPGRRAVPLLPAPRLILVRASSMDATVRSPSFMVLVCIVDLGDLVGPPPPEWESIYCSSKKAYGCGEHGQKLVEGLALYVHHRESGHGSSLCIRLSDEAFRSIRAELGYTQGGVPARGIVCNASQQLLVLILMFRGLNTTSKRRYCLVFDSADASLCMVPYITYPLEAHCTMKAIPLRGAGGKDHELVLMANHAREKTDGWCRLCVCSPATRAKSSSSDDGGTGPWKVTEDLRFPLASTYLSADVMFSFQGKVFWADVSQGVVYCDLRARDGDLRFNFAELPTAYRIHLDWWAEEPIQAPRRSRTIGCDGDSVKFICIGRSHGRRGGEVVEVWTLDLDYGLWKKSEVVLWKELWKKVKFMMPAAELGDVAPQYPYLMPDGALCLLLRNTRHPHRRSSSVGTDFICRFDMRRKSLLDARRVVDYDTIGRLVVPYDFFTMGDPPPSRKRKLPSVLGPMPEPKRRKSASRRRVCCRASCCGGDW